MPIVPQSWSDEVADKRQTSLAMQVMDSALPPRLKPLASVLALSVNDEQGRVCLTLEELTRMLGRSERYVRRCVAELRVLKILIADDDPTRNKGSRLVCGRFDEHALPPTLFPNEAGL